MNDNGLEFIETALRGYDEWKRRKSIAALGDNQLSVSAYLDELALRTQAENWVEVYKFAQDEFNTDAEVGEEVRRRMGLKS